MTIKDTFAKIFKKNPKYTLSENANYALHQFWVFTGQRKLPPHLRTQFTSLERSFREAKKEFAKNKKK